ncbi:MAG: bifunctional oligoribonuclease/PAP phosphatase NrnA [Bacteroidales bacterium]|nr:bifunctional oligoribonuclease/PAP phosphatase NrnA [Bacteroidales bacterium]MCM1146696.1 bifunctional oligoribonuclease/PAP phosphatase NrnA [Bacteroidales bacterium]MCM1205513.1 bifunctional oligoribonuclease/PAP phosphatase NrnA [Bacillota bacterium]MCM1509226.1 bifunctional oligoribonuclease/PAP phosphatase NrnA [Clostridium sp.]
MKQTSPTNLLTSEYISELRKLIDGAQNIVITCHHNPDGDALGSSLALARFLKLSGKDATVIIPDAYPDFLQWLPGTQEIIRFDKHTEKSEMIFKICDLVFCLDFNTVGRTGENMSKAISSSTAEKILIDHHLEPDIDTAWAWSAPEMCSTSQMVFHIIEALEKEKATGHAQDSSKTDNTGGIDKQIATCIYCGMMTDTGAFTYNSTAPEIYNVIARLLSYGINKDKIYRNVFWTSSVNRLRLWGHILQKFIVSEDGHSAYFTLSRAELKKFCFIKGDAEGLVNMPLQIRGMKLSISLREDTEQDNLIWVSLRSVDDFPCNKMSEQFFNGGGHKNAAGGRLYCSLEEAEKTVKRAIAEFKY